MTDSEVEVVSFACCGGMFVVFYVSARSVHYYESDDSTILKEAAADSSGGDGIRVDYRHSGRRTPIASLVQVFATIRERGGSPLCEVRAQPDRFSALIRYVVFPRGNWRVVDSDWEWWSFVNDDFGLSVPENIPHMAGNELRFLLSRNQVTDEGMHPIRSDERHLYIARANVESGDFQYVEVERIGNSTGEPT